MFPLVAVLAGAALLYFWITGWWFAGLLVWLVACFFATPIFKVPGPEAAAPWFAWALLLIPAFAPFGLRSLAQQERRHLVRHIRQLP